MAQIIIKEGNVHKILQLDKDVVSIGRSSKSDVLLEDKGVSRSHAQIRKTSDGFMIVDLDSHNGIFFQDDKIKERKLEVGDEINIGKATIIFEKELEKAEEKSGLPAEPQIIIKEGTSSRKLKLTKDVISIGRHSKNDVVLKEGGVSRIHAQIRKTPDGYVIVDFDSRNGIYFDGSKVKERKLEIGDEIEIGDSVIVFGRELVAEKPLVFSLSLSPDEFISTPYKNIFTLISKVAIIILIVGAAIAYGYGKIKEGANQKINLIVTGASFEQFSRPAMFPNGWQPLLDSTTKIIVTDKEYQEGQHSLMIEKDVNSKEFYTELAYNSIFRVSRKVKIDDKEIYSFGGWIKSDQLRRSLAYYKITWFDAEHQVIREDYSDFVSGSNGWYYCKMNTRPTIDTEYGKISCVVLGTNAKVYFDNISLFQVSSNEALPQIITDKLNLVNQSYMLMIAPSGVWRLRDIQHFMQLKGELVFKPDNIESRQSFYSLGKIVNHKQNEDINITSQIVHPVSLEMMNISMESYISSTLGINYNFPSNLYNSLTAKHFSLVCSLPIGDVRYIRLLNAAGNIMEKSLYDKISEKMITEINLGLISNIATLKYSQPIDILVTRDSETLYFTHVFQPLIIPKDEKTSPQSSIRNPLSFGIEFGLESTIQNQTDWERVFNRAKELEENNNFGEAIKLYRSITLGVDKKSNDISVVQDKLNGLENKAKESVQNAFDSLSTARLMRDFSLYDRTLKMFQNIVKLYKDTEYAERAKNVIQTIKTETQQIKTSDDKQKSEKILVIADGYLKEKQFNMALGLYQQIIQKYGETPAAQQAKQNMEKIKKE